MRFQVQRPHRDGGKFYSRGETREAKPSEVKDLVDRGLLLPLGDVSKTTLADDKDKPA